MGGVRVGRLAIAILRRSTRGPRPAPYWVGIDWIMDDIRCTDLTQCDRALLLGLEQNWLTGHVRRRITGCNIALPTIAAAASGCPVEGTVLSEWRELREVSGASQSGSVGSRRCLPRRWSGGPPAGHLAPSGRSHPRPSIYPRDRRLRESTRPGALHSDLRLRWVDVVHQMIWVRGDKPFLPHRGGARRSSVPAMVRADWTS